MKSPKAHPRRWRLKLTIFAIFSVLAALWFGPRLIDWSAMKPEIAAVFSDQFGVDVEIRGGLQIELLPQPRITVGDIRVDGASITGEIRWIRGSLDPGALIIGRIVPRDVEIVEANLTLPIAPSATKTYAEQTAIVVRDMELILTGGPDWMPNHLQKLHGRLTLGGRLGRLFSFDGEARLAGEPVGLSVEGHSGGALILGLAHGPSASDLAIQGAPNAQGGWSGRATLILEEAGFLSTLNADALARLLGEGPATLDAGVQASGDGILSLDIEAIESENLSGSGTVTLVRGNRPALDLSLDMDEIALAQTPMTARALSKDLAGALTDHADIDISLSITARSVKSMIGPVKNAQFSAAAGGGVAVIDQASALLPGDSDLSLFGTLQPIGESWRFEGEAGIAARDARAGLIAVFPDVAPVLDDIPSDRLRRVDLTGRLLATPGVLEVTELSGRIDDTQWGGAISLGPEGAIEALLQGDRLNLDRYTGENGLNVLTDPILSALKSRPTDQRLSLFFDRLSFDRIPAQDVAVNITLNHGAFSIDVEIGELAEASGSAALTLTDTSIAAASVQLSIPRPDRFAGAFGLGARQAAQLAELGETAVTLDLSVTPDKGIGFALEGLGEGGDFRANGLFVALPSPVVSLTDGALNLGGLTLFNMAGVCGFDGMGGWNCGGLQTSLPGLRLIGDVWLETGNSPQGDLGLHIDLQGAEADLGLFLARTGLPVTPEGDAILSGRLTGRGASLDAALTNLQGRLELAGEAALRVRPGGGGRLGNLDRLRGNLEQTFGTRVPLTGILDVGPTDIRLDLSLDGVGAFAKAKADLARPTRFLTTTIEIAADGTPDPVLVLTAEGPLNAPGVRLRGPWATGR